MTWASVLFLTLLPALNASGQEQRVPPAGQSRPVVKKAQESTGTSGVTNKTSRRDSSKITSRFVKDLKIPRPRSREATPDRGWGPARPRTSIPIAR